jgi:hypothetical protein
VAAAYSGDALYSASASAALAVSITGPVIHHASMLPRRVTAGHTAILRLTLSEAASLFVAITQLRHGHISGHRCSSRAHRSKRCLVRVTLLRRRLRAHAGRNALNLSLRHLAPGRYTALIHAIDRTGGRSLTIRVTFTIIRPLR